MRTENARETGILNANSLPDTIRTFIAADIPIPTGVRKVAKELAALTGGEPWRSRATLHLTLKFLGNTPPAAVEPITRLLQSAARQVAPCSLQLHGVGSFSQASRSAVIWIGVRQADSLIALASDLDERLATLGYARERRPFVPHITLHRLRSVRGAGLAEWLARHAAEDYGTIEIREIIFYRSELQPGGSRYTPLAQAPLGPATPPSEV